MNALKPTMLAQVTGSMRLEFDNGIAGNIHGILNPGPSEVLDVELAQESAKLQALQVKQELRFEAMAIANAGHRKIFELLG